MAATSIQAKVKLRDNRYVVIYYRRQIFKTGILINNSDEFDSKNGVLTSRYRGKESYKELNLILQEKLGVINSLINEAIKKGVDTLDYVNAYYKKEQKKLKKLSVTHNTALYDAYEKYIIAKRDKLKDLIEDRSFQRYESEVERLKDYHCVRPSTISDIDINWILDFCRYLATPQKKTITVVDKKREITYQATKTLKQTNSTIVRFLHDLATFFIFLKENQEDLDLPIKETYQHLLSLKTPTSESDSIIAMTRQQWEAFKKYEAREKFEWEVKTCDLFKFCTNTGLRYSDAKILNDMYVSEDNVITMKATKTRGKFEVAMNPDALEIYEKYGRDFRNKFPVNQRININLRKIFQRIPEFCCKMIVYEFSLNSVNEKQVEAHEAIKFHASRRTFVSMCIKKGATLDQLQKFTGWKDLRTLRNYLKVFGEKENNDLQILSF